MADFDEPLAGYQQGHSDRQLDRPRGRGYRGGKHRNGFVTPEANAPGVKARRYGGPRTDNRAGWAGEQDQLLLGYHHADPRRSDDGIRREVEQRLKDRRFDLDDVFIFVDDGIVTFLGTVPTRDTKLHLEWIADAVPGVRDIENRLKVPRH